METIVVVRYDEIALKSPRVRARNEALLVKNIKAMLDSKGIVYGDIRREWGRIFINGPGEGAVEAASRVFGVASVSLARTCKAEIGEIAELAASMASRVKDKATFAIRARRAGVHPFTSRDVAITCGKAVEEKTGLQVNLTSPDLEVHVEVRQERAYIYTDVVEGVRGMPLGSQGRMVALISGGIDSPVAAWLLMKRGCEIIPIYLNNDPFSDETTRQRALECIKVLSKWAPGHPFKVYEIPHGENLLAILERCERRLTCILCRRMMYRAATTVLEKEGAHGIITGASLGQVASQTSENMLVESQGIGYPIYHPLIGMDKLEITRLAMKIGTLTASTKPATCCMAVPEKPATRAKPQEIKKAESKLEIEEMVKEMIENAKITTI